MLARDVMSSPVITIRPESPVHAAAALLLSHGFTAVPVVTADGLVVGMATEANLVRGRVVPEGWIGELPPEPTLAMVTTTTPLTFRPDDDLADVVSLMLEHNVRSAPIIDDGRLVGIVSRRDVLRSVARRELTSEDVWRRRMAMRSDERAEIGRRI
ncbi:MAG: CBS domain-containing protein [Pseudonocardiales bacterium]|nr:CBS domain-containing protein [Pseudonocardiales bacterium]